MGNVITNLKARFGVDTSDFKKGLRDGEKSLDDFKGSAGGIIDEFASMFGVSMTGVNTAIGTAGKSLSFFGQSLKAAALGGNVLTISMKLLKYALIATGLGAIVVVLGSIIAYFTKTGEGTDKFAKILMQVKSIVNNVIDRLAVFGKGLWELMTGKFKKGWETMTGAFKGMGDEIKEDWKAAGDLADRLEALEDREIALINSLEQRRAKAAELRLQAKEEISDMRLKVALIDEAAKLYKSVYADQIGVERERLAIMKEQLAIQSSDPTDEQRKEVAEQEAKINSLLREQAEQLKGLVRERKAAAEVVREELALEKLKSEQLAIYKVDISNLKIPDLAKPLIDALAPLAQVKASVTELAKQIGQAFEQALEGAAAGLGEFIGALMIGDAGIKNFGNLMAGSFAELAITIGKLAIQSAITVGALAEILKNPIAWPIALAAGIALVAVGTAIKGSLSSAASGGSGGGGVSLSGGSGDGGITYDTRKNPVPIQITGKLVAEGKDLVYIFEQEKNRKLIAT